MSTRPKPMALAVTAALLVASAVVSAAPAVAHDRFTTVRPGQTLSGIAAAHGTTVQQLMRLNRLADPNRIYAGQTLRLAQKHSRSKRQHRRVMRVVVHEVRYGQTLTGIAVRYGTTIEAIARRNGLADPSRIYAGQSLRIAVPGGAGSAQQGHHRKHRPRFRVVEVHYGDTVSGLAMRFRTSVEAIVVANRLADAGFIRVGQELRIPLRGKAARARSHGSRRHTVSRAMPPSMAALVPQRAGMRRLIAAEARRAGVPASFALAVAWQESGWQPRVVSSAGAIGVMQLLPATADWVGATMLGHGVNLWDPRSNVRAGVSLLAHYLRRYGGNRSLALAAYYQGQAGTDRHGIYPVSRPYIASILLLQSMFAGR
jgi:LysM repeat protein